MFKSRTFSTFNSFDDNTVEETRNKKAKKASKIETNGVKTAKKPAAPRIKVQEVVLDFYPESQHVYTVDFAFKFNTSRALSFEIEKRNWRRVSRVFGRAFRRALSRLLGENEKMTFQFGVLYVAPNNKGGSTFSHEGLEYSRSSGASSFSNVWNDVEQGVFAKLNSKDRITSFRLLFEPPTLPHFCQEERKFSISYGVDLREEEENY